MDGNERQEGTWQRPCSPRVHLVDREVVINACLVPSGAKLRAVKQSRARGVVIGLGGMSRKESLIR